MIETYVLEHLAAVAKYGTFSKVAEELNTSQPAITRSMQKIEEELGVKLFDRTKNKISLNEIGVEAAAYSQRILDLQQSMMLSIRDMDKRSHTISFAAPAPAPITELTPLISQLYMGKTIESQMNSISNMIPMLDREEIDFAIVLEPPQGSRYFSVPFMNENLAVHLPLTHKYSDKMDEGLYLKDLESETFLLYSAVGFWHDIVLTEIPDVKFIVQNEYGTLGTLIDSSTLPSFITNITRFWRPLPKDRVIIPLNDERVHVTFYAVFRIEDRWKYEALIETLEKFFIEHNDKDGILK